MTLHRTTTVGDMRFDEDMTAREALNFVQVGMNIPVNCYVERFTNRRVVIFTPAADTRTEFTGPLFDLYTLVVALRHCKKPPPKAPSTRAMGVHALGDYLARAEAH